MSFRGGRGGRGGRGAGRGGRGGGSMGAGPSGIIKGKKSILVLCFKDSVL